MLHRGGAVRLWSLSVAFCLILMSRSAMAQVFLEAPSYTTGVEPLRAAVADFNRDGRLDVVTNNYSGASVSVLIGNGDGTFQSHVDYPTGPFPRHLAVGDFNGDGIPDLAVTVLGVDELCRDRVLSIFIGKADGTFKPHVDYQVGCGPDWVSTGDFNGDGKQDLVTADFVDSTVSVFLGNGDGTFKPRVAYPVFNPNVVVVGDFNGDGRLDLATGNDGNGVNHEVSVLLGNGDGTFQAHVDYGETGAVNSMVVADFNGDSRLDLAFPSTDGIEVLLGNGDGTFQNMKDTVLPLTGVFLSVADLNNDNRPDLVMSGPTMALLTGNGDGTFQYEGAYAVPSGGTASGDLNGDGKVDVVGANGTLFARQNRGAVSVCLGNGDGTCRGARNFLLPGLLQVVDDFNGDGKPDVASENAVMLGSGDGTFRPPLTYQANQDVAGMVNADFNGDHKPDLALLVGTVAVFLGNGDGTFRAPVNYATGTNPHSIAVGDFNGDHIPDLVTADAGNDTVSVLLGQGDGTFQSHGEFATPRAPWFVAVGDFNGDGKQDIVVATFGCNAAGCLSVLLGNGDGTFQPHQDVVLALEPLGMAVGDFNGDHKLDLAITFSTGDFAGKVSVFLGNGDGTFQSPTDYALGDSGGEVLARDFNNDGKTDLVVTVGDMGMPELLLGNGDGTFQAFTEYIASGIGIAAGDFNVDGKPDLAVGGNILLNIVPLPTLTISVNIAGAGSGLVTINPGGFTCSSSCSRGYAKGAQIDLSAAANTGSSFAGWSGDCSGTGACNLTLTSNQTVTASFDLLPDFSVSASPFTPATVSPGQTATSTIAVSSIGGFSSAVSLTCSVSPTPRSAPQCSITPNSITPGTPATLTVSTVAPQAAWSSPSRGEPFYGLLSHGYVLAMCGIVLGIRDQRRRGKRIVGLVLLGVILLFLGACGGGGGGGGGGSFGTPSGTYTITVTGTSGVMHSTKVTLQVQ